MALSEDVFAPTLMSSFTPRYKNKLEALECDRLQAWFHYIELTRQARDPRVQIHTDLFAA